MKKWFVKKCQIWHFFVFLFHKLTNQCFNFLIISLVIFDLQKCTIHQIKAKDISFWPYYIIFNLRINICWAIMSRSCAIFFVQTLALNEHIKKSPFLVKLKLNNQTDIKKEWSKCQNRHFKNLVRNSIELNLSKWPYFHLVFHGKFVKK